MPRNSSGTYTLPAGNPVVTGTLIESTWANPTLADVGQTLTDSLDRFGRGGMLAPLRFVDGTVSAPAVSFNSETTMGFYRPSAGNLSIAIGAVQRMSMTASLFTIVPPTTFTGLVTFNGGATIGGTVDINNLTNNTAQGFTTSVTTTPDWQMAGASAATSFMGWSRFSANASGPALYLGKSRGAAVGTQTIVQSGDQLAQISFFGSDGVEFREGARIVAESDGTPGVGDMPGRLRFLVTPDGGATPVEAVRISQTGAALFAAALSVAGTIVALADATVATTLNVAGATTLQTTAVIGSSAAVPANTRAYIDRIGTSVLPSLTAGTALTLAGSSAAGNSVFLQMIAGNAGITSIQFGDTDAAVRGAIVYSHASDAFTFQTAAANALVITSGSDLVVASTVQLPNGTAGSPVLTFTNSPTTGLYRVAADSIGFTLAGTERWRITSAGVLGAGLAAPGVAQITRVSSTSITPFLQSSGTSVNPTSAGLFCFDTATAPTWALARSRGATVGAHTIVASGDSLGRLTAAGSDGTQFTEAARIQFVVDGTPGVNDMPGRIEFLTTADGASAPSLALTLASDNSATFAGSVTAQQANLSHTIAVPLALTRTGSAVNTVMSFANTSGTVFVGHGAANAFAVGGASGLNSSNWFSVTSALAAFNTNGSFDGTLTSTGTARFNGATQGFIGVRENTGSAATANANADSVVIDSSGNGGLSILTPNTSTGNIYFGDPESALSGRVVYTHSSDTLTLFAGGLTALSLTSSTVTLGSSVELILDNSGPTSTITAGFRGVPQNSRSAAYTLVLADAGKHIYHPSADTTARTWTIPANASVAFPIGTSVTFINDTSAGVITIAITTDTLVLAGSGSTGSRSLAANGVATAVKVTATRWMISGTNIT